ncbi:hypothetical protein tb265_11130 [Gemmatimonadetes bacterium T265]|nr:hypothetical protein tb265_11130 [Gemmatimonadetes bacterium T265]
MLLVVEHGDQHVQVRQQLGNPQRARGRDRVVPTLAPRRLLRIQRVRHGRDFVAERLEQATQQGFAAAAGDDGEVCGERDRRGRELAPLLAPAAHRRAERVGDGDAQER